MRKLKTYLAAIFLATGLAISGCAPQHLEKSASGTAGATEAVYTGEDPERKEPGETISTEELLDFIPDYSGEPYVPVNENIPYFQNEELIAEPFETYSDLDNLGRCGAAYACIGTDLMPTKDRESISEVKPSGWNNKEYDFIDGGWLYNRCHLIGFQLTGENANEKNLITGTRYMNVEGMLLFENMVADYIKETGNHVLYRVTPIYQEQELVARGVLMEGKSVEDDGNGILFNVFVYNVQPGIGIDYADGESWTEDVPSKDSLRSLKWK